MRWPMSSGSMPCSSAWICRPMRRSRSATRSRSWRLLCAEVFARGFLVGAELASELVEAHRAEQVLGEELLDDGQEVVFA